MWWNLTNIADHEENYYTYHNYEMSSHDNIPRTKGSSFDALFVTPAILNAEFDLGLRMLGNLRGNYERYVLGQQDPPWEIADSCWKAKRIIREFLISSNYKDRSRMSDAYKKRG